jgi:hypothetical protein
MPAKQWAGLLEKSEISCRLESGIRKWKTKLNGKIKLSVDSTRKIKGNSDFTAAALESYTGMLSCVD